MHILFLSDNFPPEVNAPASRTFEHCREWVQAGHHVTVVTCVPNFPGGRVFPGYRNRLWQTEQMAGIRVVRVWSYVAPNEGFARRIVDYLSYMVTATVAGLFVRGVDIVVGTSPQFFTACAAWAVAAMKRRPFVFELRDLWPESIEAVGAMRRGRVLRWLEKLELFLYRRASLIVSVTHAFRERLVARGIPRNKIAVVTNGADLSHFAPGPRDEALAEQLGLRGHFVAGYVGTHGMAHQLETLLDAAEILAQRPGGDRVRLLLLGDGARKATLKEEARRRGLDNVLFLDTVAKSEVTRYWSLLDISIIHLARNPTFTTVIPSKLFECMAMGIPVLHGVEGESAEIVRREGCGLTFTPGNAAELASRVEALRDNRTQWQQIHTRAVAAARQYDRNALAQDMLNELTRVARPTSGHPPVP